MINQTAVENQILCQQCTAVLPVETGEQFVNCSYCGTTNFVNKSKVLLRYVVRETVTEDNIISVLRRWMAGNKTVKDLDRQAKIEPPLFNYFPMWIVRAIQNGKELVFLEPAAAISVSELKQLTLPAADLEPYQFELEAAIAPTVNYITMRKWLADNHNLTDKDIRETSLLYLPIYLCKYEFNGTRYTTIVEAASGKVFANIYPSKWEIPYVTIGVIAFIGYFLAALIPVAGYFMGMFAFAIIVYAIVAVVLAIPIFITAAIISAKV